MERYVISVDGELPDGALAGFPGFKATPHSLTTLLQGELRDQAALADVLDQLDELGVVIVEVVALPAGCAE